MSMSLMELYKKFKEKNTKKNEIAMKKKQGYNLLQEDQEKELRLKQQTLQQDLQMNMMVGTSSLHGAQVQWKSTPSQYQLTHTGTGMSNGQWRITPSYTAGTTRDVNSFSDTEKIIEITNLLIVAGFKDLDLHVLSEVQRRMRMLTPRYSKEETIKQPKKKLNL